MAYLGISLSWFYLSVSVARVFVLPNCWARWLNDGHLWFITLLFFLTTDFIISQRGHPPSQHVLFSEDSSGLLVEKKKPPWVPMMDSVLSRIWYILSLNWHSLSVTFSLGVSVSTLMEEFKKHIKPFVSDF